MSLKYPEKIGIADDAPYWSTRARARPDTHVLSIVANVVGARRGIPTLIVSARHAVWALCAMVTVAIGALWMSLLQSDLSLEYVASYTSTTLPTFYKVTSYGAASRAHCCCGRGC